MKTITIEMVRAWEPCYDPADVVGTNWQGTALDVLNLASEGRISADDALWVVLREEIFEAGVLREFARWCALSVAHLWDMPDVVRQYLQTGNEEIRAAAGDAAGDAAGAAAGDAAQVDQIKKLKSLIEKAQ